MGETKAVKNAAPKNAKVAENSKKTASRSATPASFRPGQCGNPGGRPKKTPEEFELIAACKAKTPAALAVMESIMTSGESERTRLAAATAIIDRAYGKPTQTIAGDPDNPLAILTMEQIAANPASRIKIVKIA